MDFEQQIVSYFEKAYRKDPGTFSLDTNLKTDIKFDSLRCMAILSRIEMDYQKTVSLADVGQASSIREFAEIVKSQL